MPNVSLILKYLSFYFGMVRFTQLGSYDFWVRLGVDQINRVGKARESGSVLMWIRTFFMMPKDKTIPWPVPQEYYFGFSDWLPVLRKSEREIQDILSSLRERTGSQESNLSQGYRNHSMLNVQVRGMSISLIEVRLSTSKIRINHSRIRLCHQWNI